MEHIGPTFIAVIGGIIALAMTAVILAQKAQTSKVLQAGGSALAGVIAAAVAPVSSGGGPLSTSGSNSTGGLNGAAAG